MIPSRACPGESGGEFLVPASDVQVDRAPGDAAGPVYSGRLPKRI